MPLPRIRILFLITQFDTGGVQFQLALRLKHLDRTVFEPAVIVLTGGSSYMLAHVRDLGIPVTFLHLEDSSFGQKVLRIRRAIAASQPDIVDSMLGWDVTYGNAAATLARVPFIVAEVQNEWRATAAETTRSFQILQSIALRWFCDAVVCCSHGARDSYVRQMPWLAARSTVIHDAIDGAARGPATRDTDRAALGVAADAFVVGTIGRLMEQKDHATLVRAASVLCAEMPNAIVLIGGYGHLAPALEAQIEEAGLTGRVRLLGEVTNPQRFYGMVDTFVLSSRWEGFPVVLLEAMAAGRAVVSTTVGGIAEMIDHGTNGLLCEAGDWKGLGAALLLCARDETLRGHLGSAAQDRVRSQFAIQRLRGEWESIYLSGVRQRPKRAQLPAAQTEASAHRAELMWPSTAARILVMRLCRMDDYDSLITSLRARYPAAVIDSLCQTSVVRQVETMHPNESVIGYGEGPFALSKLRLTRLVALRSHAYDLVVVPYNVAGRSAYAQAELAAALVGRGRAVGVTPAAGTGSPCTELRVPAALAGLLAAAAATVTSTIVLARAVILGMLRRARIAQQEASA